MVSLVLNGKMHQKLRKKASQMKYVQGAAVTAFAHDFISKLPDGYNTQIGQRGCLLFEGQKRRVAIARNLKI
ncbi:uncharacterized protein N7500_002010 [Penicillium coprophilum]|uniref:uncharacterized protein n=1 Tax=Penicillium coprophilum TaxID=36646 RepID=UPI00239B816B|nr:uncharacterized protein N7500_002010 [Penicillium coprophilum]KAJ5174079.1 hypothetical protein N7500_002010 [Penicillium coprophilum]